MIHNSYPNTTALIYEIVCTMTDEQMNLNRLLTSTEDENIFLGLELNWWNNIFPELRKAQEKCMNTKYIAYGNNRAIGHELEFLNPMRQVLFSMKLNLWAKNKLIEDTE